MKKKNSTAEFSETLTKVLKEMCRRVGADFNKMNFRSNNWFRKYSWTEQEQEDFKEWMCKLLKGSRQARNELLEHPINQKRHIEKAVDFFVFDYGWTIRGE